ncbi:hypothetical protein K0B56_22405, partial [Salmonella enterica subsp. enterica serovar Give]|nr:hypothetical protein [Salmonella enterica subsp. enterica serovar Give]
IYDDKYQRSDLTYMEVLTMTYRESLHTNDSLTSDAANLYDGGWRAEDRDELIAEYGITEDYADNICSAHTLTDARALLEEIIKGGLPI